ncbi:MAG: hypothetical protein MUC78_00915 [Bacteroidales bacterium]|nr:hypothetical protein [Bacteroidales bacterium]
MHLRGYSYQDSLGLRAINILNFLLLSKEEYRATLSGGRGEVVCGERDYSHRCAVLVIPGQKTLQTISLTHEPCS